MKLRKNWNCISRSKKNNLKYFAFILPSLLGVSIFVFVPFFDVIRRSFTDVSGEIFTGLDNYKNLVGNTAFMIAMKNTGRFIAVCVPTLLVISLGLANFIFFGKYHFLRKICLLPMAVPIASLVFIWQMVFHKYGLLNSWFHLDIDWIHSSYAFWVLIFSFLWKNTGYYVVLWIAGLQGIPDSLYEAASVDGAGAMRKFCHITMPGLMPVASMTIVLALTGSFKSYREAYLLAGEYPDQSIYMVQHLFNNWFREMSFEKMAACAVILVCIFGVAVYPFRKKDGDELEKCS
ncbi:MAG: sugar ABC transporter permease [Clostridiales bacterium]|nr:sugar ABC transporter permease [Clostridiales bacterium]